jgi:hypothetical protein
MAAVDLNTVRSTIEARLATELASSPAIPVVFSNMAFDSTTEDTFVQCITSFGSHQYLTQGGTSCKRLRDLYNRITVSNVIFDSPIGPEILNSSPEGKFQTQIRITFNIYEDL